MTGQLRPRWAAMLPQVILLLVLVSASAADATARSTQSPRLSSSSPPAAAAAAATAPSGAAAAAAFEASETAEATRVTHLPGWGALDFGLYSGFITVDAVAGRRLFYAFAESRNGPTNGDPVVLWLNGGPGCSSLGNGFMSELGPFYPKPAGNKSGNKEELRLQANPHSWNRIANMIFLDSPAFVGWSHSDRASDVKTGDAQTAKDTYTFLLQFFQRYKSYAQADFFIAGESYGGHYVPNAALEIVQANHRALASGQQIINLKGFLVGNAWTDPLLDNLGAVDYWWSHALISTDHRNAILKYCDLRSGEILQSDYDLRDQPPETEDVQQFMTEHQLDPVGLYDTTVDELWRSKKRHFNRTKCDHIINMSRVYMGEINIYDINYDVCPANRARSEALQFARQAFSAHPSIAGRLLRAASRRRLVKGQNVTLSSTGIGPDPPYDRCIDNEVAAYFNRPDVQHAFHANVSGELPGPWEDCSSRLQYSRHDLFVSIIPVYKKLFKAGLKILVYSGDADAMVPVTGTRLWTMSLKDRVLRGWEPWHDGNGDVGGYTVHYSNLTFVSVRGAGHMVPYTQPERAFDLFKWAITRSQDKHTTQRSLRVD